MSCPFRLHFGCPKNFRKFCDIVDVDPEKGAVSYDAMAPYFALIGYKPGPDKARKRRLLGLPEKDPSWVFVSRTGDVIFNTSLHNPNENAHAHLLGIMGRADKADRMHMYEFLTEPKDTCFGSIAFGARSFI